MLNKLQEDIAKRWTHSNSSAANEYLSRHKSAPFPNTDEGFVDLRGLCITQFIKNSVVHRVDLSHASLEGFGQFGFCQISETRFVGARLGTNLGNSFSRCEFKECNLSGAVLRGEFNDCDFSAAKMTSAIVNQATFRRCQFIRSVLRKSMFLHCQFEDCVFEGCTFGGGSIAGSSFVRSPLTANDLVNTVTENTRFE